MNLGTVTISKKGMIRVPNKVIEKLKVDVEIDAISFMFEDNEVKLKVLKGDG